MIVSIKIAAVIAYGKDIVEIQMGPANDNASDDGEDKKYFFGHKEMYNRDCDIALYNFGEMIYN